MARTGIDIEREKAKRNLSDVVARHVKLRKAGHEFEGLCPFHEERTPSFRVNDTKGVFHCFGCAAAGDVIDFVKAAEGMSFIEAVRFLADGEDLPAVDPAARERQARADRADREAAILAAQAQWHEARSISGTPAELYLRSRGIIEPPPPSIRFARVPIWRDKKTGADGRPFPALIAACQNAAGKIVGVQRIFLTEDGRKKDGMAKPKLSLGQVRGCAVRLGPPARHILLCEGPEDGLTLRQRRPGQSVWVSLGTGSLPFVQIPSAIERVTIAGDNNPAGRAAVTAGIEAFQAQGREADGDFPDPRFKDWNDELMDVPMTAHA